MGTGGVGILGARCVDTSILDACVKGSDLKSKRGLGKLETLGPMETEDPGTHYTRTPLTTPSTPPPQANPPPRLRTKDGDE